MSSAKLVDNFIAEQLKLINAPSTPVRAHKSLINPTVLTVEKPREADLELTYNLIIEKKPCAKKVVKFLQACIDNIVLDED